jgi:23S rRNA (cytosine1962-C5)-methyltransferase
MLTWSDEPIDTSLFERRIQGALRLRRDTLQDTDAFRLLHAEGDYMPGVVADCYADWVVASFLSAGADREKERIAMLLREATGARGVWERSDQASREEEGLPPRTGVLEGEEPPEEIVIREQGREYGVDVRAGHKTGFYLDQRDSRTVAASISKEATVLDCFAYTGGFSVACALGGAERILAVDDSGEHLQRARANVERNATTAFPYETREGNAFDLLRDLPAESFDVVVLDPPPFAPRASAVKGATRGYKDINMQGLRLLEPGGYLMTFSCSHHIDSELFRKVVFGAAVDAGRPVQVLQRLGQPADHPVDLCHLQGEYLKGLLLRVVG